MKTLLFMKVCLLASLMSYAQEFTIKGQVTLNNQGIEAVDVYTKNENHHTFTGPNGNYELKIPKGEYTLVFAYGNKKEIDLKLTENKTINLQWESTIEELNEVLVSSIRVKADSPITHSNLNKKEIKQRNLGQDIPSLMNYIPSVVTTTDAGNGVGYSGIRVRGSDASRVNVTINGIPYNDQESQGSFWVNLPDFASTTQNLQLQRGVGTSTNGSGAFGASLNILTEAASSEASGSLANSYGSFNTRKHTLKYSTGMLDSNIEISGRLSQIKSDGYIDRATSDLKSYFVQGVYSYENTYIKALTFGGEQETYQAWNGIEGDQLKDDRTYNSAGEYTDKNGNIKFYENEIDSYKQDHYQLHWHQDYNSNWSSKLSLNYTNGRGFFEQYKEDADLDFHDIENAPVNEADLIRRRWLDNDYFVVSSDVSYKSKNLNITTGLFYSYYTNDHFGEVIWSEYAGDSEIYDHYYDSNGTKNEYTVFSKATYKFDDQWQAFLDLQGRFITYKTDGLSSDKILLDVDQNYEFFNPKAGLSYQVNNTNQLYASYGKAHREPRRSDFENGITKAEELDDFELGWRLNKDKLQINTNLYYMHYNNQMVLTGALDDVGSPIRETSGKSYRLGLEIDASILLNSNFSIRPNVAVSRNKNLDFYAKLDGSLQDLGNTNISFSPEIVAGNQFVYHPNEKFQIALLSKYVGEQYMGNIDAKKSILGDYFVNDINLVYNWTNSPIFESVVFTGLVNNILDVEYESNGFFYTYDINNSNGNTETMGGAGYYPQAGINFLVGVELNF
ncbi:MAG: TonB-dependent receptor [Psychroflexus sp.]